MPVGGSVDEGVVILLVVRGAMSERPRAPAACMKLWSGGVGLPSRFVSVRPPLVAQCAEALWPVRVPRAKMLAYKTTRK